MPLHLFLRFFFSGRCPTLPGYDGDDDDDDGRAALSSSPPVLEPGRPLGNGIQPAVRKSSGML